MVTVSQPDVSPPGQDWMEIIRRPSQDAFAAAFTGDAALDASVASGIIVGSAERRRFFDATRSMYDQIAFVSETNCGSQTYLEWEGRFDGRNVAGVTILGRNPAGLIENIRLYHRPYDQVVAFSAELSRRLARGSDV